VGDWFAPEVKTFSRGKGDAPATAKAAYRAGVCIVDERTGTIHDYSRRSAGIEHTALFLPKDAPEWTHDRARLWNAAEQKENRKNSVTARELMLPLPHEVSKADRIDIAREAAAFLRDRYGVAVDLNVHEPGRGGDERNHHAHIMFTTRRIDGNGFGDKTRELDASVRTKDAAQSQGGAEIEAIRQACAEITNRALERAGSGDRVDPRSYERRGIDREAQPHLGPAATNMERKGQKSRVGDDRRDKQVRNAIRDEFARQARVIDLALERDRRQREAEERQRVRQQQEAKARAGQSRVVEREKARFDTWANGRRADLQSKRLDAEGDLGRKHAQERLALENQLALTYGGTKTAYTRSLEAMAKKPPPAAPLDRLLYRLSGAATRNAEQAAAYRATLADIARRETEQHSALTARQQAETATLSAGHAADSSKLERGIDRARARREADGWQPPQARREATTGRETGLQDEFNREADFSPVERGDAGAGQTAPGTEHAPTASPDWTPDGNSGAGESNPAPPPKTGWADDAEREDAIRRAREQREADEREQEERDNDDDPGREMT
jgi:hypothetical protein